MEKFVEKIIRLFLIEKSVTNKRDIKEENEKLFI